MNKLGHIGSAIKENIKFQIKFNLLKLTTAIGCMALGVMIGILFARNIPAKCDLLIGIVTGLITSTVVSLFFDSRNKATQKKKDDAIKRATIFRFWNNTLSQCMNMLGFEHPLYHHACDIDFMEKFVEDKIVPLTNECNNTIQFYSAALTKQEFDALKLLLDRSQYIISVINSPVWDEMKGNKEMYHRFYYFLGYRDKIFDEMSMDNYEKIKKNVEYMYSFLRDYLNALENTVYVFGYLFNDTISYRNLHSSIVNAEKRNKDLLKK